jgi:hypothetical protein
LVYRLGTENTGWSATATIIHVSILTGNNPNRVWFELRAKREMRQSEPIESVLTKVLRSESKRSKEDQPIDKIAGIEIVFPATIIVQCVWRKVLGECCSSIHKDNKNNNKQRYEGPGDDDTRK